MTELYSAYTWNKADAGTALEGCSFFDWDGNWGYAILVFVPGLFTAVAAG